MSHSPILACPSSPGASHSLIFLSTSGCTRPGVLVHSDQGCQFTSADFTDALKSRGIRISMDGRGRWLDNVFVERLWRSVKYEEVYLHAYDNVMEARRRISSYLNFYNQRRPHSSLDGQTPDAAYFGTLAAETRQAA